MRKLTLLLLLVQLVAAGEEISAFDYKNANDKKNIDVKEIVNGLRGMKDPRDGIPAIDNPKAISAKDASKWLGGKERVLGMVVNGEARAYPLRILMGHEMVNDVLGGQPVGPNY